jgi:PAS domain-containing protein
MAGHDSEGRLMAAARLAGLGYWRVEAADNRVSWSEETCRVLGLSLTERSRPWAEFLEIVIPEDRPLLENCVVRVARGEPGYPVVLRLTIAEGDVRYVESTGEPVRDGNGRTVSAGGSHSRRDGA